MTSVDQSHDLQPNSIADLEATLANLPQDILDSYSDFFGQSEALLIANIGHFNNPEDRRPLPKGGYVEFGIVPYWCKYPHKIPDFSNLPKLVQETIEWGVGLLTASKTVPSPQLTDQQYADIEKAIKAGTAVSSDGTYFGTGIYQQLNYDWLQAVVNDLLTHKYGAADFGSNAPQKASLPAAKSGPFTIAVIGDWGTGEGQALAVRNAIEALDPRPDFLIHLGDVYYTGSPDLIDILPEFFWGNDNETDKLVNKWPSGIPTGASYTLNSNHEMYCGGKGYFDDAMKSDLFAHQNCKSYFLLQNEKWQIFGLDSAFHTPSRLYMEGALGEEQITFLNENADASKQIIILTHHNAFELDGRDIVPTTGSSGAVQSLWADVLAGLKGRAPDRWYWGHVHNGIKYKPVKSGSGTTHMSCIGHSAMPYGAPWGLTTGGTPPFRPAQFIDTVDFFAQTPIDPDLPDGLVKCGFATLTFDNETVTETWFDSDGKQTWPVVPGG